MYVNTFIEKGGKSLKCPECGTENSKEAKFCEECGKKLPEYAETLRKSIEEPKRDINTPKQNRFSGKSSEPSKLGGMNKRMIIAIAGIIVIVGVIGAYVIATSSATVSPQNGTVCIFNTVSGNVNVVVDGKTTTYNFNDVFLEYGSGFVVSKDGYIVTAAHVISDPKALDEDGKIVRMDDDKVKFYLCRAAAVKWLESKSPGITKSMSVADINTLTTQAMADGELNPSGTEQNIYIMGPSLPDSNKNPPVARIVDMGDSSTEIDVALLKIDNLNQSLPTLKISSDPVKVGDSIFAYGYPTEQFDFYSSLSDKGSNSNLWKDILTASLTKGIVSAQRPSPKGMQYYQTDAAVDHGNSGGPVLNDKNQVIGILVMGFDSKQGFNFFIPSNYITDMCKKNGVNLGGGFF